MIGRQIRSNKTTARLVGGLGNQLFIYFAGFYVSKRVKTNLVCDLTRLDLDKTKHGVSLTSFKLDGIFEQNSKQSIAMHSKLDQLASRLSRKSDLFRRVFQKFSKNYVSKGIGYDPELEKIGQNITINGYFQTWRYIQALGEEFELNLKLQNPSEWYVRQKVIAENTQPVVVHVRQGDYLEDINSFIGVLGPVYYKNALKEVRNSGINAPIWVFSDDIESAKAILSLSVDEDVIWIEAPIGTDPAEELALMQFGGAHIIANSTFSWWGAYFSKSSKTVIAPGSWFKGQIEPLDLIPPEWKRIENDWL